MDFERVEIEQEIVPNMQSNSRTIVKRLIFNKATTIHKKIMDLNSIKFRPIEIIFRTHLKPTLERSMFLGREDVNKIRNMAKLEVTEAMLERAIPN